MKLPEAKQQFIQSWGTLGASWGINRAMAQVHALLLISPEALSTEAIMDELQISRGSANMNVRELIDWGLIQRVHKPGERREFFAAEKDIWVITRQVAKERKKRELEPVLKMLEQVSAIEGDRKAPENKAFLQSIHGIQRMAKQADKTLELLIRTEENSFFGRILKAVL